MRIIILLLVFALSGCQTMLEKYCAEKMPPVGGGASVSTPDGKTTEIKEITIDDRLLADCGELIGLNAMTGGADVLDATAADVKTFNACKNNHKALADHFRKYFKQPDQPPK